MHFSRELDPVETRILGCLLEKQQTTPENYPLTLNSLLSACNQQTNREPVMSLSESEVQSALDRLQDEHLVWRVSGSRAIKFDHNLDRQWSLGPASKAIMGVLLLRGEQTAGELRTRTERMFRFESVEDIDVQLRAMAAGGLVRELPRRPGQKETRWQHLASGAVEPAATIAPSAASSPGPSGETLAQRVTRVEESVAALMGELAALKEKLGE
jgi:uncharacterized protein YceH (UPF0502 family)